MRDGAGREGESCGTTPAWVAPVVDVAPWGDFYDAVLLSTDECESIIAAAEASEEWRSRGEYNGHRTTDMDASSLLPWLSSCVRERFLPLLRQHFGVSEATLESLRVVKYVGGTSCAGLPLHSDGTPLSFVCALTPSSSAGTYVRVLRRVISPPAGHALLFCGRWLHAGVRVLNGEVRYVLTGFVEAALGQSAAASIERIAAYEQQASITPRSCPAERCWLRREFASAPIGTVAGGRICTGCGLEVAPCAVRHCCDAGCCGTRWCDACLAAAVEAEVADRAGSDDDRDELPEYRCEFVCDVSLPDGSLVAPGSVVRKVWRLSQALADGSAPWGMESTLRRPRLVRSDFDADESIGSRCLGEAAITLIRDDGEEDGLVEAAVELVAPTRPGAYRLFFSLVIGRDRHGGALASMAGCDELFADFYVGGTDAASREGWRSNQLLQRQRLGPAVACSWGGEEDRPTGVGTLVIAFAGADASMTGAVTGGVPSYEFAGALRRVNADAAIFLRDVLRAWYLRGIGESGHDFESVLEMLRREIRLIQPRRVVTIGCSMGGYAALRAAIALRAAAAVAFAPQVYVRPDERRGLQLPKMGFDPLLESLAVVGVEEGFALPSIVECIREASAASLTEVEPEIGTMLEVHVGGLCPGDVHEARALESAVHEYGERLSLRCKCTLHAQREHCLAADMRDTGELHEVLSRLVLSTRTPPLDIEDGELEAHIPEQTETQGLPMDFVGFEDCDDF